MNALDLSTIRAVVFDTDGVVTDTARVHAAAWKHVFDAFLRSRGLPPFDVREDYLRYVDGRSRMDGIRTFLASRDISLDEAGVLALAAAKDALFVAEVARHGVASFPSTVALLYELRRRGSRTAVVSASKHCREVIASAGLTHLFDVLVDGNARLPGKPDPALFLEAADRLGVPPARCAVVEDAVPGVEAGLAGGFGLVIGVDRQHTGLFMAAHLVVADLAELTLTGKVPA
ncbi:beta-phosphoglucomutase family hydrolase [Nonomuraea sp. NBC_01738]|uniref:HAD family hydrolase n=1 Tax=Nonomuraea sp. NBC_01738 TaxID=2976003 RepID=UPI002E148EF6|nr:beta-phosphoglucomutase family hydrolase [Nonomuraea sp. NBC_01738]